MNVQNAPQLDAQAEPFRGGAAPSYMSGFGNSFETEALAGALPIGRNSPQRVNYGLYAEQLSGSPFTAPQATNQRSWLYRIRPAVKHSGRFRLVDKGLIRTAPAARDESNLPIGQMRWSPVPIPSEPLTFMTGLRTVTTAGDAETRAGMAAHLLFVTASMRNEYFFNADGEMLIVPQTGPLRFWTEFGVIDVEPGEVCVIQRGVIFRIELIDGPARAYVCENYGGGFQLPDRGPIGANCLANARDFLTPVAAYEDKEEPSTLYVKWGGELYATEIGQSPLDVVAWHGNYAPYKYDLRRFSPSRRADVRSPRSVDLHGDDGAVGNAWHRQHRPRDLSRTLGGGGEHLPAAVVSPQPDVGVHGADLRRLRRQAGGLRAGRHVAAQLHAAARPRRAGVRTCQHDRAQTGEACKHHGVHVRDSVSAAPDRLCGRTEGAAGRLHRLLARTAQTLQPSSAVIAGRSGTPIEISKDPET